MLFRSVNFWKYETATEKATKLTVLDTTGVKDCLTGAAICGSTYYTGWDLYPSAYGVLTVDLTAAANYTHAYYETDSLIHSVGCDGDRVLVIGSQPKASDQSAQFTLSTFDAASGALTKVGDFPDTRQSIFEGFDSTFRIEADGKTAIMAIGKGSSAVEPHQSFVYTMDTTSGELTGQYTARLHALYTVFDGLKRGITVGPAGDKWDLKWADVSCSGDNCAVKVTGSANDDWNVGNPFADCGDSAYLVHAGNTSLPLMEVSIAGGKSTMLTDLTQHGVKDEVAGFAATCTSGKRSLLK